MIKLNARQLRDADEEGVKSHAQELNRKPLYLILENIYDTYNVGGLFRLADALACKKIYLCGTMEIPPNSKIKKASIGTYKVVPWEYKQSAKEAIDEIRKAEKQKVRIVAVEQDKQAVDYRLYDFQLPLALIVGNETSGVTKETLQLVDRIVEIPMWGINKSLNVIVSAAIVSYFAVLKS